jgi:hypothetical protein
VIRGLGGFDERLLHLTDWDLWLRLVEAHAGTVCREFLIAYVKHSRNMLTRSKRDALEELDYLVAKYRDSEISIKRRLAGGTIARWIAMAHQRNGKRGNAARAYLRGAVVSRDVGSALRAVDVLLDPWAVARSRRPVPASQLPHTPWLESYHDAFPIP